MRERIRENISGKNRERIAGNQGTERGKWKEEKEITLAVKGLSVVAATAGSVCLSWVEIPFSSYLVKTL